MKFVLLLCVSLVFVLIVEGGVFLEMVKVVDGKCQIGGQLKEDGEEWPEEGCIKRICDAERGVVNGIGCGSFGNANNLPKECKIVTEEGDNPKCCPKVVCESVQEIEDNSN